MTFNARATYTRINACSVCVYVENTTPKASITGLANVEHIIGLACFLQFRCLLAVSGFTHLTQITFLNISELVVFRCRLRLTKARASTFSRMWGAIK